ncbi:patatin-like protein [Sphingomonas sp. KR1UV-12]|uniref:Patatin-like protein n=1 Tax=Sphingomonas aurea TaxID=3063994 RepID=A0ABT9EI65_9SPHN|nr:patatin-like protein [Sphingomonas sp. KR1UV-12]MDP1026527.1 patatin-like protein [Sphingomonas sp. KR1UV-12]
MREKELRLALVCYGGISLAVYMHGITKEIWRLTRASRAWHEGAEPLPGTDAIYHALLGELEERGSLRLRVLADIVAGASAGGINGIFLAQAISTGQSLDPLTDLWLSSADVDALIDPAAAPSSRFSKMWALPLAWMAAGRSAEAVDALDDAATREEVRAKLSRFVRSRWFEPPFGGETFTGLLLDALALMADGPRGPRLLPEGQPLDLFVTVTDFGGHPERLPLNSPPEVIETEHRVVVSFSDEGEAVDMLAAVPELAFAARATSSFPGAFPPFTVAELDAVLARRGMVWRERDAFLARILPRRAAANGADKAVLIDGSVLANAPFRPAINALRDRPARRQVDRRFVYIDPSPGTKFRVGGRGDTPGFFQTILGALSELPRQQPIRDNLDALATRSRAIERMRGILDAIRPAVEAQVEAAFGRTLFLDRPTPKRIAAWRARAQATAAAQAGYGYTAYGHLKLAGVVDSLGALAEGAGADRRARAALSTVVPTDATGAEAVDFFRRFDTGFRIRRLRLLARRLGELEERAVVGLEPVREAIYLSLAGYLDAQRTDTREALRPAARRLRHEPAAFLDALAISLDLSRLDEETDERLASALAALDREARRPLLLAYLGFPFFDAATLPLLQGEGVDEFDAIRVDRIAPDDAVAIRTGGAEATLKGIQFNSFGAFFSRAYRENDYLWGRLHGAERLVDIVVSSLPPSVRLRAGRVAAIKRSAFLAILDEEEPRLTAIPALIASLRREIG